MAVADHFPQTGPHLVAESAASRPSETLIGIGMPAPENHPRAANEPDTSEHLRSVAKKNPGLTRSFSSITEREKPMSRLDNLNKILKNLQNESPGVEASALISEDGLMIASALPQDLDETRVAGMTATLLNLGTRAAVELRRGDVREVIVRGEHGYSVMISAGRGALLLVLTNENSKLGLIFFDMREAIKAIRTIL
jgi:predicted regulator of Ras-like GTPase activity (Roadblock/LC7/MglB family)